MSDFAIILCVFLAAALNFGMWQKNWSAGVFCFCLLLALEIISLDHVRRQQ